MEFRVLLVDDDAAQTTLIAELIQGNKVLKGADSIVCEACASFSEALDHLKHKRFDLVILDLKDDLTQKDVDATNTELAGEKLYAEVKKSRFIPIIFYSGYAEKIKGQERTFVRMVTKGEVEELRVEVEKIFNTKLPRLMRHLDEELRIYMWESIEKLWENDEHATSNDIVYLITRRLANLLQGDVVREFFKAEGLATTIGTNVHPVEMYIWPPLSKNSYFFGDILYKKNEERFYVVLSPSCDLQQNKSEKVMLGKCIPLSNFDEAKKIARARKDSSPISGNMETKFKSLIENKSKPQDRRRYLPGTNFLPDLILDLQDVTNITFEELGSKTELWEKITSLDNPFAESLQAQLTKYYGRIGTPDLDHEIAYTRAVNKL